MGAPIVIALAVIALAALAYILWALFAAGRGAAAAGKSVANDHPPETAPHTDEHTKTRSVDTNPPENPRI